MAERKISAQALAADIEAGMDHSHLMEKYALSSETLQRFYGQLSSAGLISRSQLDSLMEPSRTAPGSVWTCPACGASQPEEFAECPVCGIVVSKFKKAQKRREEPFDQSDQWNRSSYDSDADEESDDDTEAEPAASVDSRSGEQSEGAISHVLDWMSDTASSISESVSEWASSASEPASGEASGDAGSDAGYGGGDSGSDGGGGGNGGGGDGGGNGGGGGGD